MLIVLSAGCNGGGSQSVPIAADPFLPCAQRTKSFIPPSVHWVEWLNRFQYAASDEERGGFEEAMRIPVGDLDSADAWVTRIASASEYGMVFVSGVDGGDIQPVDGIYGRLASRFAERGVASIFVMYRSSGDLEASVQDALAATRVLIEKGARKLALVGWSFGGAVVIQTAVRVPETVLVIGFAPQSRFTDPVHEFKDQKLLLFHSYDDENVSYEASLDIMERAPEEITKSLVSLSGADHRLDGFEEQIDPVAEEWLGAVFPEFVPQC